MGFDRYPAVDDNTEFPPEVAKANMPIVLSTSQRDALAAARKWDGRQIYNSTTKRYERWDSASSLWRTIADQQDMSTLLTSSAPVGLAAAAAVGSSNFAARSDHVHPRDAETKRILYNLTLSATSAAYGDSTWGLTPALTIAANRRIRVAVGGAFNPGAANSGLMWAFYRAVNGAAGVRIGPAYYVYSPVLWQTGFQFEYIDTPPASNDVKYYVQTAAHYQNGGVLLAGTQFTVEDVGPV